MFIFILSVIIFGISTTTATSFECKSSNMVANAYCADYCQSLNPGIHAARGCSKDEISCFCVFNNKTVIVRVLQDQIPKPYQPPIREPQRFIPQPQPLHCDASPIATNLCNSFCTDVVKGSQGLCNTVDFSCRCKDVPFVQKEPIQAMYNTARQEQQTVAQFPPPIPQNAQVIPAVLHQFHPIRYSLPQYPGIILQQASHPNPSRQIPFYFHPHHNMQYHQQPPVQLSQVVQTTNFPPPPQQQEQSPDISIPSSPPENSTLINLPGQEDENMDTTQVAEIETTTQEQLEIPTPTSATPVIQTTGAAVQQRMTLAPVTQQLANLEIPPANTFTPIHTIMHSKRNLGREKCSPVSCMHHCNAKSTLGSRCRSNCLPTGCYCSCTPPST